MTGFSALLVGNESLTRECGAQLLAHGHRLAAVVTLDAQVRSWAEAAGLAVIDQTPGWEDGLGALGYDWLLSVANLHVIAAPALSRAAKGAINFHDGPLPAYAGLNAPVWAILNGEARHGITWHLIGQGIDDGDILVQRHFDITPGDTALTLNTKCFAAAIDSFPELVAQMQSGLVRRPQDIAGRRLYRRSDRPAAFGRIDFAQGVEDVLRLVRGLDHGDYWNPMTTAKIVVGDQVLNVAAADLADGSGAPGQILQRDGNGLVVACADGAVRLSRLTCQTRGLPVAPDALTDAKVTPRDPEEDLILTATATDAARHDGAMRQRLMALQPATVDGATSSSGAAVWQHVSLPGVSLPELALAALRLSGQAGVDLALSVSPPVAPGYISDWVPLRVEAATTLAASLDAVAAAMALAGKARFFASDLLTRERSLAGMLVPQIGATMRGAPVEGTVLCLLAEGAAYDQTRIAPDAAQALVARLGDLARRLAAADRALPLDAIPTLGEAERETVLTQWNQTAAPFAADLCVHQAVEQQAARTPDAVALVCDDQQMTYAALNAGANQVAHVLRRMGVGPGVLVGLCLPRSLDMVVGALAIQKAGGAYVPMDPGYPADRIALYIEDSACPVIVTATGVQLPGHAAEVLLIDADPAIAGEPVGNLASGVTPGDLAYMIYTSGSTGRPKGVMVEHRNVVNFFAGMDDRIGTAPGTWMAVTSLSFDISVLELFWTLSRGFKVVLTSDEQRALVSSGTTVSTKGMELSLYYWGNDDGAGPKKYELLLEGARFGDENGFCAIWTPERHFHAFGGPYPNPAVTGAAVAGVTKRIGVRAGSCVAPLHHPARIAEDWAVIDNMTNGRAGIAFASGWQPDDFVLRPENTPPANKAAMLASIDQVRRLWRGEAVEFPTAKGSFAVTTQPRPVSAELPVWVTTAGNPDTWREAGALGANVLTHLLGQSIDEIAGKIAIYHDALRAAGHDPADRTVTLMLHTYLAETRDLAREAARGPMKEYLRSAAGLIKQYAWAFPAFKKPAGVSNPLDIDMSSLSTEDLEAILDFAFQRYFDESGLFGTVDDALARVETLKAIGVDEVACLIDYGIEPQTVLAGLRPLAEVLRRTNAGSAPDAGDFSIAAQIARHGVTHLQCTPSMARMLVTNPDSRIALAGVQTLMLGGEALPGGLVGDLRQATKARLLNMYGPTETTIWSSTSSVEAVEPVANIGRPLANQQMYVLDDSLQPVAPSVAGELWIGGHGVTRGYWQRPDLTAERFRPDPFVSADRAAPWGARMYRTGDLVRWRTDGRLDFLGRADGQVKLRGYRIELGEVEAVLEQQPGVTQAVVLMREDNPGDLRLVAYLTGAVDEGALRQAVASRLPEHMVPAHLVMLDRFPLTPNRKVDRKALPPPMLRQNSEKVEPPAGPSDGVEGQIAAIWSRVLGVPRIGKRDNFFALGGHSLLAVQVHRELRDVLGATRLSITDIFRFPTLGALAAHLDDRPAAPVAAATEPDDRAEARSDAMSRRAAMRMRRGGVDA